MEDNTIRNVLIGASALGVGAYIAKKVISAKNLQSQISFYVSNVKANGSIALLKKGRIEIATTLRIINGSDLSIPFSIPQAQILYKGVQVGISKPDEEIILTSQQTKEKVLTFEVPLTNLGLQSDVITDLVSSLLQKGGISAKLDSIFNSIKPNITYNVSARAKGVVIVLNGSLDTPTTKAIGLSANDRIVSDGSIYNQYFEKASRTNITLDANGDVPDVISNMVKVVEAHYKEVSKLAKLLEVKGDVLSTARNIWNFSVKYLHYHNDRFGVEELRTPARSWYDGQINHIANGVQESGIDCDDFAIFCGSILRNLNIPFQFRITKYNGRSYFQHVYLYIPNTNPNLNKGKDIIIDPVVDAFNYEKPYSEQADDFAMGSLNKNAISSIRGLQGMPIEMLNGVSGMPIEMLGGLDDSVGKLYNDILQGIDLAELDYPTSIASAKTTEDILYNHLVNTRKVIASNPKLVDGYSKDPLLLIAMFDKAIQAFYTPNRDSVLDALDNFEKSLVNIGIIDLGDTIEEYQISGGFFKKVGKAVKKANKTALNVAKKVGKAIVKFNPLSIAVRNGMLAAFKLNAFHLATKVKYGYLTEAQAKALNLDMGEYQKSKNLLNKSIKIFKSLEGKEENLRKAINHGREVKAPENMAGLGEPVTTSSVGVAMAVITPLIAEAKKMGGDILKKKAIDQISKSTSNLVESATKKVAQAPANLVDSVKAKVTQAPANLVNSIMNKPTIQAQVAVNPFMDDVIEKAVVSIDKGNLKASHYYKNILTEEQRKSLSPKAYQLIMSRVTKEAFGIKPTYTPTKPTYTPAKPTSTPTQENINTETQENNNTETQSYQSTQTNTETMPVINSQEPQEGFFQKYKKPILIGTGLLVLAGLGYGAYKVMSNSEPEVKRVSQSNAPNREATQNKPTAQGLGSLPKTRKRKKATKYPKQTRLSKSKLK